MNTTSYANPSSISEAQDDLAYEEWLEGQAVIQGHDGSIVAAFKDYRDDLLLELEKRIYNNLKVEYDSKKFDVYMHYSKACIEKMV